MQESPTDGSIIADVLSGQRDQFSLIVGRYQSALFRLAISRLGRRDWAEDVVQETFLWAFKSLHSYDSKYSFRTWLWTILLNQCNRHYQKRSRRSHAHAAFEQATAVPSDEPTPPVRLLEKERAEQLEQLLRSLPDAQADALRLRFFGGLKFHEIAAAMGCSLSSAKNRVRWGLTKMGKMLSPRESSDATLGDAT